VGPSADSLAQSVFSGYAGSIPIKPAAQRVGKVEGFAFQFARSRNGNLRIAVAIENLRRNGQGGAIDRSQLHCF
jgi:hypothetical protein